MINPRCKEDMAQVYISAEGLVMPCCWMGNMPHVEAYKELHKEHLSALSIHARELEEILQDPIFSHHENTWNTEQPFSVCERFCGKEQSQKTDLRRQGTSVSAEIKLSGESTLCSYPFNHIAITAGGEYRLCCEAEPSGLSIDQLSPQEWFSSDYVKGARAQMIEGKKVPACSSCYRSEERGRESKRLRARHEVSPPQIDLEGRCTSLDLRFSNKCNATCVTCNPVDSSAWGALLEGSRSQNAKEGMSHNFVPLWSQLESVYFAGGEPFLISEYHEVLEKLDPSCVVQINTNLSVLNPKFITVLKKFKNVSFILSCDGVGEVFEEIRPPLKFATFIKNFDVLTQEFPRAHFYLNSTISAYSILYMDQLFEFFNEYPSLRLLVNPLRYPAHLQTALVPKARLREILSVFEEAKGRWVHQQAAQAVVTEIEIALLDFSVTEAHRAKLKKSVDYWSKRRKNFSRLFNADTLDIGFGAT